MKAHIRGALTPLVLVYGLPENEARSVYATCAEALHIPVRTLSHGALSETVGALAALDAAPGAQSPAAAQPAPSPAFDASQATPLLLMANFPDALINTYLGELRAQNAPPILKAIVTKHNKTWTLHALLQELLREKEEMERVQHDNV